MKRTLFSLLSISSLVLLSQTPMPVIKTGTATASLPKFEQTNTAQKAAIVSTGDTLLYFFNKHFYRNPAPTNNQFLTIKSPIPGTLAITHCGALFLNTGNITVTGLEGLVARNLSAPSLSVPVTLYLCNVNGINQAILPPIDSIATSVSSTQGTWVGGNFNTPHNISGKFAVLFKKGPSVMGDTVLLFLNNACTAGSNFPAPQKYGEGLGTMRFNGGFVINTNVFGTGTDHEFIVAPRVLFSFSAGFTVNLPTVCNKTNGSFSANTVLAGPCENRQFNFNKFAARWQPFQSPPPPTDSVYNWTFTGTSGATSLVKNPTPLYNQAGNQNVTLTLKYWHSSAAGVGNVIETDATTVSQAVSVIASPAVSLTVPGKVCSDLTGGKDVTLVGTPPGGTYNGVNVFTNVFSPTSTGTFVINYSYTDISTSCTGSVNANIVVQNCTGIDKNKEQAGLYLYPNPTDSGELTISNLEGENVIEVYNLLGERILKQLVHQDEIKMDLKNRERGIYLIRISDSNGKVKNLRAVFE